MKTKTKAMIRILTLACLSALPLLLGTPASADGPSGAPDAPFLPSRMQDCNLARRACNALCKGDETCFGHCYHGLGC